MLGLSLIFGVIAINLVNIVVIFSPKLASFFKKKYQKQFPRTRETLSRREESYASTSKFQLYPPPWWPKRGKNRHDARNLQFEEIEEEARGIPGARGLSKFSGGQ